MTKKAQDGAGGMAKRAAAILEKKKAVDVKLHDVRGMSDLWDYFVVCSGLSPVHVRTLLDHLEDEMEKLGRPLAHKDTGHDNRWVISDYGDFLVHIFDADSRQYYAIEKMWGEKEELPAAFIKKVNRAVKAKKEKRKNAKKRK
jgi:ribosome-associated protein